MQLVALRRSGEAPVHPETGARDAEGALPGAAPGPVAAHLAGSCAARASTCPSSRRCCAARCGSPSRGGKEPGFPEGRRAGSHRRARPNRPCARALRQPSGHRRLDRAPADRHPLQLHGARQRPLRGSGAARRKVADARFVIAISEYNRGVLLDRARAPPSRSSTAAWTPSATPGAGWTAAPRPGRVRGEPVPRRRATRI